MKKLLKLLKTPKLPAPWPIEARNDDPKFFHVDEAVLFVCCIGGLGTPIVALAPSDFPFGFFLALALSANALYRYRMSRFLSQNEIAWANAMCCKYKLSPLPLHARREDLANLMTQVIDRVSLELTPQQL